MSEKVGTGYVPIKPDSEGFGPELEKQLDKEGTPAAKRSAERMSRAMKGVFLAGVGLMTKAVLDFGGFEKGMNEVFTLIPGISGDAMGKMTEQVKDFSKEFKVLPNEVVPALYEALGAGVPADNVFTFLETAQKLAVGGVTELNTAVDGLSSVTNAYGADVISAAEASDIMFKIVGLGKGTLDDVAGSLFNVTPVASALGVSFEDVGAAMALLSSKGTPVSVATTQIRAVLSELGKDGTKVSDVFKEMSGKSFAQFMAEGGNLADALTMIDGAAKDSGLSIMDLFGSMEAGSAALTLVSNGGKDFTSAIEQMENAAGSTDAAYAQMNKGLSATLDGLKANFAVVLLDIGGAIAPTIGVIGGALAGFLEVFSMIPGPLQAVAVLLGTVTAGLFAFAGPILKGIQLFKQLNGVFSLLAANPWVLVIMGLVLVTVLIIKNWDKVKAALSAVWEWMLAAGRSLGEMFVAMWQDFTGAISAAWDAVGSAVTGVFGWITTKMNELYAGAVAIFGAITSTISGAWATVTGIVTEAWNTILGVVTSVGGAVVGFITAIPRTIGSAFGGLADIISAPFRAAFNTIKTVWNATVGGFGFSVPNWIPFVGGNSFTIPSMAAGGVLGGPQLFLGGEYPGAATNPEIVAPQNIMRETVIQAIDSTGGGGGGGLVVNGPLIGEATIRDERDIVTLSRELAREQDRRLRGAGRRVGGVNAA